MRLELETIGDVQIVHVRETRLTYPMRTSFFAQVREAVEGGARKLLVDLAAAAYADSTAIGCLMDIRRLLEARGGFLGLSGLQPRVETMLAMTGLLRLLEFQADDPDGRRRPWAPATAL